VARCTPTACTYKHYEEEEKEEEEEEEEEEEVPKWLYFRITS
jgi:hypothetical protein